MKSNPIKCKVIKIGKGKDRPDFIDNIKYKENIWSK